MKQFASIVLRDGLVDLCRIEAQIAKDEAILKHMQAKAPEPAPAPKPAPLPKDAYGAAPPPTQEPEKTPTEQLHERLDKLIVEVDAKLAEAKKQKNRRSLSIAQ